MAGIGQRFSDNGIDVHKPLLPINNENMYNQALKCLPQTNKTVLGVLKDKDIFESSNHKVIIDSLLPGQLTVEKMIEEINPTDSLLISSCDNGVLIDPDKLLKLINDDYDIIVWTYQNNFSNIINPDMYSWVNLENEKILSVDVKTFNKNGNPMDFVALLALFYFDHQRFH